MSGRDLSTAIIVAIVVTSCNVNWYAKNASDTKIKLKELEIVSCEKD